MKRNPAAVCWANFKQYFVSKNIGYCYAIDDIISYHELVQNLMEFWTNTLSNRIYNLDYELLTVNQESETRQLIEYLGLDWDENCLSPQNNTRSVEQRPIFRLGKKFTKVVRSNGKNINHSSMEHLMVCCNHELGAKL